MTTGHWAVIFTLDGAAYCHAGLSEDEARATRDDIAPVVGAADAVDLLAALAAAYPAGTPVCHDDGSPGVICAAPPPVRNTGVEGDTAWAVDHAGYGIVAVKFNRIAWPLWFIVDYLTAPETANA